MCASYGSVSTLSPGCSGDSQGILGQVIARPADLVTPRSLLEAHALRGVCGLSFILCPALLSVLLGITLCDENCFYECAAHDSKAFRIKIDSAYNPK